MVQENLHTWGRTAAEPANSEISATSMGSSAVLAHPTVASALAIAGGAPAQRSGRNGESKCVHRAIHMRRPLSRPHCSVSLTAPLVDAPSPLAPAMAVELVKAESIRRRSAEAPPAPADMVASDAADSLTLPSRQHADTFHSDYFLSESLKLWVSRTIMVVSPAIRLRGTPVAAGRLAASRMAGRRGGGRRRRRRVWPCSATCGSIGCW